MKVLRNQLNTCLIEWQANCSLSLGLWRSEQIDIGEAWHKVIKQRTGRHKKGNSECPREWHGRKNPLNTIGARRLYSNTGKAAEYV